MDISYDTATFDNIKDTKPQCHIIVAGTEITQINEDDWKINQGKTLFHTFSLHFWNKGQFLKHICSKYSHHDQMAAYLETFLKYRLSGLGCSEVGSRNKINIIKNVFSVQNTYSYIQIHISNGKYIF